MIVLPDTPPLAVNVHFIDNAVLSAARTSIVTSTLNNYNDCVKYAGNLENYLGTIFSGVSNVQKYLSNSSQILCKGIPWTEISMAKDTDKTQSKKPLKDWTLSDEVQAVLIASAFISIRIGSELANELIEEEEQQQETNVKWQQVSNEYKKSIAFSLLGIEISNGSGGVNIFPFLVKIAEISMQMSILSKFSWINRTTLYSSNDISANSNNGTLSRVAIYITNELSVTASLQKLLQEGSPDSLTLNCTNWNNYFSMISKYSAAYAGLFLAIENYQQGKIGHAIGLVNFSLLSLQSKYIKPEDTSRKPFKRLRAKISKQKNESILHNLDSVSTLQFNKSSFKNSTVVLNDISYLFETLISLNLKFDKENSMLAFDKVVDWSDIQRDSKWPIGAKIPMSPVKPYNPLVDSESEYSRPGYY